MQLAVLTRVIVEPIKGACAGTQMASAWLKLDGTAQSKKPALGGLFWVFMTLLGTA